MPIYEYSCEKCGHKFDESYKIDDRLKPESEPCPNCQALEVKQQISAPGCAFDLRLKPRGDFRERMQQIKKNFKYDRHANIKDY